MRKIGDLFVRLGLKKDEFSKGIKEAKRESSSFTDTLKSIGKKGAAAFAVVGAAIAGVVSTIKNLSKQNQALGDAWNRMTAGMAASWDTFKTAVASMDFSHLLSDMREANRLARDLYDAQDALGEIGTSYNISLSKQLKTINELKVQLRDMNLSDEKRIAAGNKLLKIYQDLESNPTRGLSRVSDASLDQIALKLGYNLKGASEEALKGTRKQVEQFFIWLGTEAGEKWNQAYAAAYKDPAKLMQTTINAQNAGLSDSTRAMLWNYQGSVGEKDRIKMEEAVTAYYQQQAKYSGETMRIQTQINSIKASGARQTSGGGGGTDTEANEIQRIQDSTKSQIQLLQERYDKESALLRKHGEDTTALTEKFQNDLVAAFSGKAKEGNLLESVMEPTEVVQAHYDELLAIMEKYNLDTHSLEAKRIGLMAQAQEEENAVFQEEQDALDEWSRAWLEEFERINGLSADPLMDELHQLTERTMAELEMQEQALERAKEIANEFGEAVAGGFSDACQELMDQLFGLEEMNTGAVIKAMLDPLAKMAIKMGEVIVAEGIAMAAARKALANPYTAIAAGAALIAIGAAASAALSYIANNAGGGSSQAAAVASAGNSGSYTENIETELTIYVKGRISGSDIVISGERTVNNWNR